MRNKTMKRKGDWIQTFTGIHFYPFDPKVEEISIFDIAHALSFLCRFGGHCTDFYSVAEHSWRVSRVVPGTDALWGLLHDATEAYILDLPRPIKRFIDFSFYKEHEDNLMKVICERFNLPLEMPESVREADDILLMTEARDLMRNPQDWSERSGELLKETICPIEPVQMETMFLNRFKCLGGKL
jgi:5'-deoxynucleotidase YfbR-like HD superfamily hydrolase